MTLTPEFLATLPRAERIELLALLQEKERRASRRKLFSYKPYAKQREFHAASTQFNERLFMAGNQLGKTWSGAYETAIHLTGEYPDWWTGRRFDHPIRAMAGSESAELTTKGVQRLLVGPPEDPLQWGTGAIPGDAITRISRKQGVANAIDSITVKHKSGGTSVLKLNSYDQGRSKWQADTVHLVWFDEEPPYDLYFEGITRTNATDGIVFLTFTPLMGMSQTVDRFYPKPKFASCTVIQMTIEDAEHYTPEKRAEIIAKYPAHERDARMKGIPTLGSGRIFPLADEDLHYDAATLVLPDHWPRIAGIDFGWDHPTAVVWMAWDRDEDVIYVYDTHRQSEGTPEVHAPVIKRQGDWVPVAWPHDGLQHDKGSGVQLAELYREQKINMLWERAQYEETGTEGETEASRVSVERGLMDMLQRMRNGKFKVAKHLNDWYEEFRMYHRKDGKIVKERDDVMSATRYAMMMLRHASVPPVPTRIDSARREYDWRAG